MSKHNPNCPECGHIYDDDCLACVGECRGDGGGITMWKPPAIRINEPKYKWWEILIGRRRRVHRQLKQVCEQVARKMLA